MQPIDKPFRLTLDFCIVWGLFAIALPFVMNLSGVGPWYAQAAAIILFPLFATFVIYGPVLLTNQVLKSGAHGFRIVRILLSIFIFAVLILAVLWFCGYYTESRAGSIAFAFSTIATIFLEWRKPDNRNT